MVIFIEFYSNIDDAKNPSVLWLERVVLTLRLTPTVQGLLTSVVLKLRVIVFFQKCFKTAVESSGWSGKSKTLLENNFSQNERGGDNKKRIDLNKELVIKKYISKERENSMTRRPVSKYYRRRSEAERVKRSGERIYLDPDRGYYIRRPRRRSRWDLF